MKLPHYNHLAAIVLLSISAVSFLFSQDPPIEWGEIPRADLEMKTYPADTNASAVILCDYGESNFNDELNIVFQKHIRIKILTQKGYEWGNHSVNVYTKDDIERIHHIEGATYFLNEQGTIVKNELRKKDIFEENIDEAHSRYHFALPSLQPGCVIEIRYTIETTKFWFIQDWSFQYNEPVRWSEYRITHPNNIIYAIVTNGYEVFTINETQSVNQLFSGAAAHYLGGNYVQCTYFRLAIKDIPALREEPYITTLDDYRNKLDVQLSAYSLVGTGVNQVLNSWTKFVDELIDSKEFCQRIDETRQLRKTAEQITSQCTSPEEKVRAIYDWVSNSIVCTSHNRIFAEQEGDEVLESKKGSNADITFLLLSLLKCIGINGEPVLLSTRTHGKIQEIYPILRQFDYVLAHVSVGTQAYYLDATDPMRPMELLPIKVLNVRGLLIRKDAAEWITFATPKKYTNNSLALLTLNKDGALEGTLEDAYREYAGFITRRSLRDKKDIEIAKGSFQTEQADITIDSVLIEAKDSINAPLKLKAWIHAPSYAQCNGDLIYFNPHILHRMQENPFKLPERKFPVDYSYKRSYTSMTKLTLPDSFEVKQSILSRYASVGSDLAAYTRKVQIDSNQIQIYTKLEIMESTIKPNYYSQLKDFYARIVNTESEQIVLSKIKKPVSPPLPKQSHKSSSKKAGKK